MRFRVEQWTMAGGGRWPECKRAAANGWRGKCWVAVCMNTVKKNLGGRLIATNQSTRWSSLSDVGSSCSLKTQPKREINPCEAAPPRELSRYIHSVNTHTHAHTHTQCHKRTVSQTHNVTHTHKHTGTSTPPEQSLENR